MYKVQMIVELEIDVASPEKALQVASFRLPSSYGIVKVIGCELSCHSYQQEDALFNDDDFDSEVSVQLGEPIPVEPDEEALI